MRGRRKTGDRQAMGIDVERYDPDHVLRGRARGGAGLIQGMYYKSACGGWLSGGLRAFTAAVLGGIGSMSGAAWAVSSSDSCRVE